MDNLEAITENNSQKITRRSAIGTIGKGLLSIALAVYLPLSTACKKNDSVPQTGQGNVVLLGQGVVGTFDYVEGSSMEFKASNYPGADQNHIIARKPNMGTLLGLNNTDGRLAVNMPAGGADIIVLRAGSRYSAVEGGRLAYGRRPTWSWTNTSGYTPTTEETGFVENMSDEFSAVLSSRSGLNLGSLTKVSSGGNILQQWANVPGGPYASRTGNYIAYNAARIRPNTALAKGTVNEELFEVCIGLDDILGHDSADTICDASGNLNREGEDLLYYSFAKEN